MKEEIEKLFKNAKVVTYEQISPFIGNDSELFWTGDENTEGMLNFLDANGFEIIPCRKKGEKLMSEIYVAFDRFKDNFPEPQPLISVSDPASELIDIHRIKTWALKLAKELGKGFIEISKYRKDGFKIFFSRELTMDYTKMKKAVLAKLCDEMELEIADN